MTWDIIEMIKIALDVLTFEVDGLVEYEDSLTVTQSRCSVLKLSTKINNLLGLISLLYCYCESLKYLWCLSKHCFLLFISYKNL